MSRKPISTMTADEMELEIATIKLTEAKMDGALQKAYELVREAADLRRRCAMLESGVVTAREKEATQLPEIEYDVPKKKTKKKKKKPKKKIKK